MKSEAVLKIIAIKKRFFGSIITVIALEDSESNCGAIARNRHFRIRANSSLTLRVKKKNLKLDKLLTMDELVSYAVKRDDVPWIWPD